MPNWCANRLEITLHNAADMPALKRWIKAEGGIPDWQTAIAQSLHLLLAGCAGILKPVKPIDFPPFPPGSLPELSSAVLAAPVTSGQQTTGQQVPAASLPEEGVTQPSSSGEAMPDLLSSDAPVPSAGSVAGTAPEELQQTVQEETLADDATLLPVDVVFTAPDTRVPPSGDVMYALELSGLMPTESADTAYPPVNNDDNDEEMVLRPAEQPVTASVHLPVQTENTQRAEAEGELFWLWLKEGLLNGRIENNTPTAKVHSVMGYLFCQSPAVFFHYAQEQHKNTDEVNSIIASFELLRLHRVIQRTTRQTGHFRARIYGAELNPLAEHDELIKLPHKKISGYMIKGSRIFGMNMPEESPFIRIVGN